MAAHTVDADLATLTATNAATVAQVLMTTSSSGQHLGERVVKHAETSQLSPEGIAHLANVCKACESEAGIRLALSRGVLAALASRTTSAEKRAKFTFLAGHLFRLNVFVGDPGETLTAIAAHEARTDDEEVEASWKAELDVAIDRILSISSKKSGGSMMSASSGLNGSGPAPLNESTSSSTCPAPIDEHPEEEKAEEALGVSTHSATDGKEKKNPMEHLRCDVTGEEHAENQEKSTPSEKNKIPLDSPAFREARDRTVYFTKLDSAVSDAQFRDVLNRCGEVNKVRLCGDRTSGRTLYGFVEFSSVDAAYRMIGTDRAMLGLSQIRCLSAKSPIQTVDALDAIIDPSKGRIRACLYGSGVSPTHILSTSTSTAGLPLSASHSSAMSTPQHESRGDGTPKTSTNSFRKEQNSGGSRATKTGSWR